MVIIRSELPGLTFPEDRNCTDWILEQISDQTDRIALVNSETEESYSYGDLRRLIPLVSHNLRQKLGVKRGDVMCIFAQNTPEYAILLLAALHCDVIITGVNPGFTPAELKRQLDDGEVTYIFTQPQFLHKVKATGSAFSRLKGILIQGHNDTTSDCITFNDLLREDVSYRKSPPGRRAVDARSTIALLPYSSGTTGLPKGVMISHYNMVANLMQMNNPAAPLVRLRGEILVEYAPFYHVAGLMIGLMSTLLMKGTVIAMPTFEYHKYLGLIQKYRATFLKSVPPILLRLSKDKDLGQYDLSSLRAGAVGSAPTAPETLNEVSRKLGIHDLTQGWGMSETTCIGTYSYPNIQIKPASVGKLCASTEAKIVNPETLEELSLGERGELLVRGPQIMVGYWRKPQQTKDTITADGWLRTGDIAYIDDDHYIYIVDRLKELIKVKGYQVAPAELEGVILSHPGVLDAAVVGVNDDVSGELPRGYVVLRQSHTTTVSSSDIHNHVNTRVARYKQLKGGIIFVSEIPKSPTGKILRRLLRQQANKVLAKL